MTYCGVTGRTGLRASLRGLCPRCHDGLPAARIVRRVCAGACASCFDVVSYAAYRRVSFWHGPERPTRGGGCVPCRVTAEHTRSRASYQTRVLGMCRGCMSFIASHVVPVARFRAGPPVEKKKIAAAYAARVFPHTWKKRAPPFGGAL